MNNLEQNIMQSLLEKPHRIYIRNAGIFRFPSSYRFNIHNHKEVELICINSGHCVMRVEKEFIPLKQGDCISIAAGIPHNFIVDNQEKCSITQLEFQMELPQVLGKKMPYLRQDRKYYKICECETVKYLMESLCRIFRMTKDEEQKETQLLFGFFQLFIELSAKMQQEEQPENKTGKTDKTAEIIRYINKNYDTDINMEILAETFDLSSRYVRKCFARETGMNCQQYITMLRMNKAKELLWFSADSVTEIAMKTGFNSSQYFSRVFHRYMEMTPLEYRNLWKGSKARELCTTESDKENGIFYD